MIVKSCYCTSLLFVTFGWLFIAGSLYKALLRSETEYKQTLQGFVVLQLSHMPRSSKRFYSWEWHIQDVTSAPPLAYIQCERCVGECSSVSHCVVGSCVVSDYIKSINTRALFLRRTVPRNWLFQWLRFRRSTQELLCLHQYGNDARGVSVTQRCISVTIRVYELKLRAYFCERAYLCVLVSLQAVKLSHWALLRDSIYYTFSVTALIVVRGHRVLCKYTVHMMEWGDRRNMQMCLHCHLQRSIWGQCKSSVS